MQIRSWSILSLCALSAACAQPKAESTTATTSAAPADSAQSAAVVQGLVTKSLDAMAAGDVVTLDSLTAPDHVHIADGKRMNEKEMLEHHKTMHAPKFAIDWIQTRVYGDVVVVNADLKDAATGAKHHLTQVWARVHTPKVTNTSAHGIASNGAIRFAALQYRDPSDAAATASDFQMVAMHASLAGSDESAASVSDDATNESAMRDNAAAGRTSTNRTAH